MNQKSIKSSDLKEIEKNIWKLPTDFRPGMKVPARVIASEKLLQKIVQDRSLNQLANSATLPGVCKYVLAMPDAHEGYGLPIGGVVPIDKDKKEGIISPGTVGFDINCGIRLLASAVKAEDIKEKLDHLAQAFFEKIPAGVGSQGPLKLSEKELDQVLIKGVGWCLKNGYGQQEDKENCEEKGEMEKAQAEAVSDRAKKRGRDQLGTLGAGNHFIETQKIDQIFDSEVAEKFGLFPGQVAIMVHCGSRGLGHQVCTDYTRQVREELPDYNQKLPDPELAGAPYSHRLGQQYFAAMSASANFAWANRQVITHWLREAWEGVLGSAGGGELRLIYDLAHNMAKEESHQIDNQRRELIIHRKGATRAFPDQPIIIPGSMGTSSYLMLGTKKAMEVSFGSTAHGAGRTMSRGEAKRKVWGENLRRELAKKGIIVKARSLPGLAEEAPVAYKDIEEVVKVVEQVGIGKKVARLTPLAVIKG